MGRLLIDNVDLLTLDEPEGTGLQRDASILIDGRVLRYVGPADDLDRAALAADPPDEVIDGSGQLALPGLFNAHCHAAMTLQRGWAEDLPFERWLNEKIWVAESALQEDDVYWGAALAACEMLRAGVVGFADHYFWMDRVASVVEQSGMKALLAWCRFGQEDGAEVGQVSFEHTVAFARRWHGGAGGRIRTAIGPHSPYICPPAALRAAAEAAAEIGVGIHLHLAESEAQRQASVQRHGCSPVAHVAKMGIFERPTIAAHCIAVSEGDIAILAEKGVFVAHTPKTYMKLAMGVAPLDRLLAGGARVAFGSDGPASNSDLNLLEVLRLVGLQRKQVEADAAAMPIAKILQLACSGGAKALGFDDSGRLTEGCAADLVLVDTRGPHWIPRHDVAAGVVYASHPSDVTHVIVDGRLLLRRGDLLTLDEERICGEAERRAMRMVGQPMTRMRDYRDA